MKCHYTIYGSESHNRRQCNEEPNDYLELESVGEDDDNKSHVLSDTDSTWKGFINDDQEKVLMNKLQNIPDNFTIVTNKIFL